MRTSFLTPLTWRTHAPALLSLACVCVGTAARATGASYSPPPFGYYQPILDRMPFGALPSDFNAAPADPATLKSEAEVKAQQQDLAKKVNMSAVNVTPDGATAIGFTDLSVTPPVNHYLRVGETSSGWNVLTADYDTEIASLEKDGVTITLKLGKGLIDAPATNAAKPFPASVARAPAALPAALPAPAAAPAPIGRPAAFSRDSLLTKTSAARAAPSPSPAPSYADRQRERLTQKTQEQQAAEAKLREQFEKLARETATREIQRREVQRREEEEAEIAAHQPGAQPIDRPEQ